MFTGKTEFVRDLVTQWKHTVPNTEIKRLSIVYATWQKSYDDIINSMPLTTLIETRVNLPASNDSLEIDSEVTVINGRQTRAMCRLGIKPVTGDTTNSHLLLVDDCLIDNPKSNEFLTSIFTIYSHHANLNCIVLMQELFNGTSLNRTLARSAESIILIRSAVTNTILRTLQSQYFVGQQNFLIQAYRKILARGGRYIVIDLSSRCNDLRRVKFGYLKGEASYVGLAYLNISDTYNIRVR